MENAKECLKAWKMLMSSLFSRSMPFLVTGLKEDTWLYTNVIPEQMKSRTLTPDSSMQFVHFKDNALQLLVMEAFPLLKNTAVILNLSKVNNDINKFGIEKCSLVLENLDVHLKVTGKDDQIQLADLPIYGKLLSQYELDYYNGFFERYVNYKTIPSYTAIVSPIDKSELNGTKSAVNTVRVRSHVPGTDSEWKWFRIPMVDGFNFPSMYEYGKKCNVTDYILNAMLLWKQKSVEAVICYDDNTISVRSICPRRLWYPILEK